MEDGVMLGDGWGPLIAAGGDAYRAMKDGEKIVVNSQGDDVVDVGLGAWSRNRRPVWRATASRFATRRVPWWRRHPCSGGRSFIWPCRSIPHKRPCSVCSSCRRPARPPWHWLPTGRAFVSTGAARRQIMHRWCRTYSGMDSYPARAGTRWSVCKPASRSTGSAVTRRSTSGSSGLRTGAVAGGRTRPGLRRETMYVGGERRGRSAASSPDFQVREGIRIPLPAGYCGRLKLHVEGGGQTIGNDMRGARLPGFRLWHRKAIEDESPRGRPCRGEPCLLVPKLRLGMHAAKLRFASAPRAAGALKTRSRASRLAFPSGAWERGS